MPSTSATTDSTGSVQPSSPSSRVPSDHDQVGRNVRASIAAMPMAAVSTRAVNFSVHAQYAGSEPRSSPRSAAVASASAGPSPASSRSSTDASVTAGSRVDRRDASSTSATRARHCGTVTSFACSCHVMGRSRSPRGSSSRATASSCRATRSGTTPVVGHHGRWCASHPAASAASMKRRKPGERSDVPSPARERRVQPLRPEHGPRLPDLVAGDLGHRAPLRGQRRGARARAGPVLEVRLEGRRVGPQRGRSAGRSARSASAGADRRRCARCHREPPAPPSGGRVPARRATGRSRCASARTARGGAGRRAAASPAPARRRRARPRVRAPDGPRRARPPGRVGRRRPAGRPPRPRRGRRRAVPVGVASSG